MSRNPNKPVSATQTQKAANESAGAKAQKVSDNDILNEVAKTDGQAAQTGSVTSGAGSEQGTAHEPAAANQDGPSPATDQGAAQVPGETLESGKAVEGENQEGTNEGSGENTAAGEPAAEQQNSAIPPADDKPDPGPQQGPLYPGGPTGPTEAEKEAELKYNTAAAKYKSILGKDIQDGMRLEDINLAIEEELDRQQKEQDKKEAAKNTAEAVLEQKRLRKYGKGYIHAEKGSAKTIFTALAWRNLGENKEGWRQVVEVPDEIKGKKAK